VIRQGTANWIFEAEIVSFFDSIDRKMLMEMVRSELSTGRCCDWSASVGAMIDSVTGTAQGSALSPLLGNIYFRLGLREFEWVLSMIAPSSEDRAT